MKRKNRGQRKDGESSSFVGRTQRPAIRHLVAKAGLFIIIMSLSARAQIVDPETRKISEKFVCQCGCSEQLSVCAMLNCGSATPLRAEIAELLKQGKTEKEITAIFVAKYGKVILAAPTTQGFDLTAWTMPFVMFLLGLGLIYYLIKLWAGRRVAPAAEGECSVEIPQDYGQRIERELKDLDS